jgi:hypothetical protein
MEASDHLLEPSPLLGDWLMHPPSQFVLDPPEGCPRAIAPCRPFDKELPTPVAFTDEGKAEKVEGLRFSKPAMSALFPAKRPYSPRPSLRTSRGPDAELWTNKMGKGSAGCRSTYGVAPISQNGTSPTLLYFGEPRRSTKW